MDVLQKVTVTGLQHIGIPVTNLEASESFYTALGFRKVMHSGFDFQNGKGTCIMMQHGQMVLELYQMPEEILEEVRNRKDGHIDHIAFDVTDIDRAFKVLKETGYTIVESAPVFLHFWKNGCKYFNILGPDGERLEFNQIL